ncbi:hypothetical protein [Zooshikella sp. RANM57]
MTGKQAFKESLKELLTSKAFWGFGLFWCSLMILTHELLHAISP